MISNKNMMWVGVNYEYLMKAAGLCTIQVHSYKQDPYTLLERRRCHKQIPNMTYTSSRSCVEMQVYDWTTECVPCLFHSCAWHLNLPTVTALSILYFLAILGMAAKLHILKISHNLLQLKLFQHEMAGNQAALLSGCTRVNLHFSIIN